MGTAKCGFCKSEAKFEHVSNVANFYDFNCPICKYYFITHGVYERIKDRPIDNSLLWCISENIKYNASTYPITTSWHSTKEMRLPALASDIVVRRFEHYESVPVPHAEKSDGFLKWIAERIGSQSPFSWVKLELSDYYLLKINGKDEAWTWLSELRTKGLIEIDSPEGNYAPSTPSVHLTTGGWRRVADLMSYRLSNTGFIAMSFGYAERHLLEDALTSSCNDAGWKAQTIDRQEYVGGIVDAIIARINEARFVVADLTEHKNGVYFEAGYALGRGIPVIFTLKDSPDEKEKVHFDVQHLNQIRWKDYDDLKLKLSNRLKAILPR